MVRVYRPQVYPSSPDSLASTYAGSHVRVALAGRSVKSALIPSFPCRTSFSILALDPKYSRNAALGPTLADIALKALSAAMISSLVEPGPEPEHPARSMRSEAARAAERRFTVS